MTPLESCRSFWARIGEGRDCRSLDHRAPESCETSSYLFRGPARERRGLLDSGGSLGYDDFLSCGSSRSLLESNIILLPVCDHVIYLIV